jgi:hypothetical protein
VKQMMTIFLGLSISLSASAADDSKQWQEWLFQLPNLLEERTENSSHYMKNYLQCMDDQQALKSQPQMTIGKMIDNALDSGNQCAPLLNEMLNSLTDQPIDSLTDQQKKDLLKQSL